MKITKVLPIVVLAGLSMVACSPKGELVGAAKPTNFKEANPYGMVFIRKGAFLMGPNTQSAVFNQPDNNVKVSVNAFWMDETEITNNEYRQFVNWVRDSIAYTLLIGEDGIESEYAVRPKYETDDEERYAINWKKKIPWEKRFLLDDPAAEALNEMFYDNGHGLLRTSMLNFNYYWENIDQAKLNANKFDVARGRYQEGASVRVDTF